MSNRKYNNKGFSPLIVIVVILFFVVVGLIVYILINPQTSIQDNVDTKPNKSNVSTKIEETKISDEEAVIRIVCMGVDESIQAELSKQVTLRGNYAHYAGSCNSTSDSGGANYFLKKENGSWKVIESGNGDISCEKLTEEEFPQEIAVKCGGPDFVPDN